MYQPNTQQHYPSLVVEVSITHENRERLLTDASDKYFHANTSAAAWIGLKINLRNFEQSLLGGMEPTSKQWLRSSSRRAN